MHRRDFLRLGAAAAVGAAIRPRELTALERELARDGQGGGWTSLFNGRNLDGWYSYLNSSGRGAAENRGYLSVERGMIRVMGNPPAQGPYETGYLATLDEYENYRFRLEYRWGTRRFPPRLEAKRDNGIIYHVVGQDRVWPTCSECQIQETDTGDGWLLGGARAARGRNLFDLPATVAPGSVAASGAAPPAPGTPAPTPAPGANPPPADPTPVSGRIFKEGDFEKLDDWNVVEVVTRGDRALHIVNGRINNSLMLIQQPDSRDAGQFVPLTRGRIAIQIEYAEVWFRRIEIRPGG